MNEAARWLPDDHSTGKPDLHFSPPDLGAKSRISYPGIARLAFGVATLKSAQQGRDFVFHTVPKKAAHSSTSDSHSIHASSELPGR